MQSALPSPAGMERAVASSCLPASPQWLPHTSALIWVQAQLGFSTGRVVRVAWRRSDAEAGVNSGLG